MLGMKLLICVRSVSLCGSVVKKKDGERKLDAASMGSYRTENWFQIEQYLCNLQSRKQMQMMNKLFVQLYSQYDNVILFIS